jgi:hypothetical protein
MIIQFPTTTANSVIAGWIEKLISEMREINYGEVGLVFRIHDSRIVSIEQIKKAKYQI